MTDHERKLIELYRSLDGYDKYKVRQRLKELIREQEAKKAGKREN